MCGKLAKQRQKEGKNEQQGIFLTLKRGYLLQFYVFSVRNTSNRRK